MDQMTSEVESSREVLREPELLPEQWDHGGVRRLRPGSRDKK